MSKHKFINRSLQCAFFALVVIFTSGVCGLCASGEGRFTHSTEIFSIVPPPEFTQVIPRDDGVQFINLIDKSFLNISFSDSPDDGHTDGQRLDRFKEDEFRRRYIAGLEASSASASIKVTGFTERDVNGIPAWEFATKGTSASGPIRNKFLVFYKNKKDFLIILGAKRDFYESDIKALEEALSTFEVLR